MSERGRSTDRVRAAAEVAGFAFEIRQMPASTRTAEEAAAACGVEVGQIVKSLVFRKTESREPVLLLVSGANRVDMTAMESVLGEAIERMDAEAVRAETGFAIGGVAPLGSVAQIATFMDADLLAYETVWAAAGAPNAVFQAAPDALAVATRARIVSMR